MRQQKFDKNAKTSNTKFKNMKIIFSDKGHCACFSLKANYGDRTPLSKGILYTLMVFLSPMANQNKSKKKKQE